MLHTTMKTLYKGSALFVQLVLVCCFCGVMEKATERKSLVKELRVLARQTGVVQVRDDSSRPRVEAMFNSIVAKAETDAKSQVTKLFETYQASFKVEPVSLPVQKVASEPFRLRGRSFLFTYNWDFFHKPLPDGTPAVADSASLWKLWQSWEQVVTCKQPVTNRDVAKKSLRCYESFDSFQNHVLRRILF